MKGQSASAWLYHASRVEMLKACELLPHAWKRRVEAKHERLMDGAGRYAAGEWVKGMAESMAGLLLPMSAGDADIREEAGRQAQECMRFAGQHAFDVEDFHRRAGDYCRTRKIEPPISKARIKGKLTDVALRAELARMTCPQWWRRQLRKSHGRTIESHAIELGYVHARAEKYASDVTCWRRADQKRRNADALAATQAVNQDGECMTLAELAERSNANPKIRRAELMTRISGFEAVARAEGHVAEFWTLTAPSRFHAMTTREGKAVENPKHDRSTPRDAQAHLCAAWAKFRAALDRLGCKLYGFRVAEPHQDGCPHWHVLAFLPESFRRRARALAVRYFLTQHAPDEMGAQENRVKFMSVQMTDTKSAAGYIAKYISKNIDGYQVQKDLFGQDAVAGAARIDAWAGQWGIRQFQQIGGAPVGVWRELRRLRTADAERSESFEEARAAADAGLWADYVKLQGGPTVRRADLALVLAKTRDGEAWNGPEGCPEPAKPNQYGEERGAAVFGLLDVKAGRSVVTRFNRWEIKRNGRAVGVALPHDEEITRAATASRWAELQAQRVAGSGFGVRVGFSPSWTRVNNCTEAGHADDGNDDCGDRGGGVLRRDRGRSGVERDGDALNDNGNAFENGDGSGGERADDVCGGGQAIFAAAGAAAARDGGRSAGASA